MYTMVNIPFLKKKEVKEPTPDEIRSEIWNLKGKLKTNIEKGDATSVRLQSFGFYQREEAEIHQHRIVQTEFPSPARRFRLSLEYPDQNVGSVYYWFQTFFNESWGFDKMYKVLDTSASSVSSSTFGNVQARLGAQQGQASQYLKGISEMVKGLFQIVRELRVIDERLSFYYDSLAKNPKRLTATAKEKQRGDYAKKRSSEIVLKGIWIDQVEGGAKNPGSVYGLSSSIGFTILPDLFFREQIDDPREIEKKVDKLDFNRKVKEVLKRKLRQYHEWKTRTMKELEDRRGFELKYLRQHYDTIKLYISWIKPYLRNLKYLSPNERLMDDPNLLHTFETELIEVESLYFRDDFGKMSNGQVKSGAAGAAVSVHIMSRTKPELAYHAPGEYQHKGPIHIGQIDITLRSYAWDSETVQNYIKYRQDDDIDLIGSIDKSLEEALDSLGDELKRYLKETDKDMMFPGDKPFKAVKAKQGLKAEGILEPFIGVILGFSEILGSFSGGSSPKSSKKKEEKKPQPPKPGSKQDYTNKTQSGRASGYASESIWQAYQRYKMGPGGNLFWFDPL